MKWVILLAAATAFAKTPSTPPPAQPEWDADLFKRDEQVFSSHLEFLYWTVQEGGLDYAIKMRGPASSSGSNNYAQGKFENSTYNIDPGFRVAMSYFRASRLWEMWGMYTRLTSYGHSNAGKPTPSTEFITGTWPQILTADLAGAETSLHLNYNVADLLVDRYFNPNPHLRLRLIAGLTGAWMDQNWTIRYFDSVPNTTMVRSRWSYGGAGLRFGLMADWYWMANIYVTGRATFAALTGHYRNRTKQTSSQSVGGSNPAIPLRNGDYTDTRIATNVQVLIGPSYQKSFCHTRMEFFVGYELTGWVNLQEIYRSTSGTASASKETLINSSLLSLQGLTARLTFDY
jgi:hypothetical protein